jgi:hypothetical protein
VQQSIHQTVAVDISALGLNYTIASIAQKFWMVTLTTTARGEIIRASCTQRALCLGLDAPCFSRPAFDAREGGRLPTSRHAPARASKPQPKFPATCHAVAAAEKQEQGTVSDEYTKAYGKLQNGSDVRGVALDCALEPAVTMHCRSFSWLF